MGGDAPNRVVPQMVSNLGMTQGKVDLSESNIFHQGHRPKTEGGSTVLNQ
jgi:hypothetical protein